MALTQQATDLHAKFLSDYKNNMTQEQLDAYNNSMAECKTPEEKARMTDYYLYYGAYTSMQSDAEKKIYGSQYDDQGNSVYTPGLEAEIQGYDYAIDSANSAISKVTNKNDGLFDNNKFADIGFLEDQKDDKGNVKQKGLYTKLAEANEMGYTEQATIYQEAIDTLETEKNTQTSIVNNTTARKTDAESKMAVEKAKQDLALAYQSGNESDIQSASDVYMKAYVSDFDLRSNELCNGINSPSEATAFAEQQSTVQSFKEALGISTAATTVMGPTPAQMVVGKTAFISTAATTVMGPTPAPDDVFDKTSSSVEASSSATSAVSNTQPVELTDEEKRAAIADFEANGNEMCNHINSASDAQKYQETVDNINSYKSDLGTAEPDSKSGDKPDPYAFTNPERPADMSDTDYKAFCETEKAAHIDSVNKACAEEIWTKGSYGNGQERIDNLTAAGYDVSAVQSVLNDKVAAMNAVDTTYIAPTETVENTKSDTDIHTETMDVGAESKTSVNSTTYARKPLVADSSMDATISRTVATAEKESVNNLSFDAKPNDVMLTGDKSINMTVDAEPIDMTVSDKPIDMKVDAKPISSARFSEAENLTDNIDFESNNNGLSKD